MKVKGVSNQELNARAARDWGQLGSNGMKRMPAPEQPYHHYSAPAFCASLRAQAVLAAMAYHMLASLRVSFRLSPAIGRNSCTRLRGQHQADLLCGMLTKRALLYINPPDLLIMYRAYRAGMTTIQTR